MAALRFSIRTSTLLLKHFTSQKYAVQSLTYEIYANKHQTTASRVKRCFSKVANNDTSAVEKSENGGLHLSDSCVKQLKKLGEAEGFLRVFVEGGGCSGFQYKFELDTELTEDDRIFEQDGVRVVVDDISLDLIKGSTIDYEVELIRSAFVVINNPKADTGCSCGVSFSLKI